MGNRENSCWKFTLYVAGGSDENVSVINNLRSICAAFLGNDYNIEIIDLVKNPELSRHHRILAVPTVVRSSPLPERRVIGDLSRFEQVISGLGLPLKP